MKGFSTRLIFLLTGLFCISGCNTRLAFGYPSGGIISRTDDPVDLQDLLEEARYARARIRFFGDSEGACRFVPYKSIGVIFYSTLQREDMMLLFELSTGIIQCNVPPKMLERLSLRDEADIFPAMRIFSERFLIAGGQLSIALSDAQNTKDCHSLQILGIQIWTSLVGGFQDNPVDYREGIRNIREIIFHALGRTVEPGVFSYGVNSVSADVNPGYTYTCAVWQAAPDQDIAYKTTATVYLGGAAVQSHSDQNRRLRYGPVATLELSYGVPIHLDVTEHNAVQYDTLAYLDGPLTYHVAPMTLERGFWRLCAVKQQYCVLG